MGAAQHVCHPDNGMSCPGSWRCALLCWLLSRAYHVGHHTQSATGHQLWEACLRSLPGAAAPCCEVFAPGPLASLTPCRLQACSLPALALGGSSRCTRCRQPQTWPPRRCSPSWWWPSEQPAPCLTTRHQQLRRLTASWMMFLQMKLGAAAARVLRKCASPLDLLPKQ